MNLRLDTQSVRLRLTREEMRALATEGRVETRVRFAPGETLVVALVASLEVGALKALWQPATLIVMMPEAQARAWADSGQIGYSASMDVGEGQSLEIRVEWDFKEDTRNEDAERRRPLLQPIEEAREDREIPDLLAERHEPND